MDYLDFELCIGEGEGRLYPVSVLRSPAGETKATMEFPLGELELKNQLQTLQIALLKSGSTRRDATRPQEQLSVEEFGRTLFGALLPEEIRSSYRLSRQKAQQEGKGLRLRLRIEAPDLAALPWEFLYDDHEADFVCLSADTPVVRYLELDRPPEPIAIEPPLQILGMIASPGDRAGLDVEREKQRMSEALADLEASGRVNLTWLEGETWRDLQRAMRQGPWHVFHFVGHGGFDAVAGEGMLAFADDEGGSFHLPATQLGRLLADHHGLSLAVLNACEGAQGSETDIFSSTASVLIRRGIPAVVAMQYEITDRAAIEFSRVFYESLADGLPVDTAVAEARKAISLSVTNTVEWGTPVLHMRAPDGRLFDINAAVEPPTATPATPTPEEPPTEEAQAPIPAVRSAESIAAAPVAVATASPDRRALLRWGGIAAAALAVVLLGAWLLLGNRTPDGPTRPDGPPTPQTVASIALLDNPEGVIQGTSVPIRAVVLDSTGQTFGPEDVRTVALRWWAADSTIVRITPGSDPTTGIVEGLQPGTVEIFVGFADTTRFSARVSGKGQVTVLPDEGNQAEAYQAYLTTMRAFSNPAVADTAVLGQYQRLLADYRGNLQALGEEELQTIEDRIGQLERVTTHHAEVQARTRTNDLTVSEAQAQWTQYLAHADSVRKSPATVQARTTRDSLQAVASGQATLLTLHLCNTGALDCPENARVDTFAVNQRVYFSARVRQPQRGILRWEWRGPEGTAIETGSDTLPASEAGYRTFRRLDADTRPGRYELRLTSENDHLIGRRTFIVR